MPIPITVKVKGFQQIEANLKVLREQMGVKTGGILIRGLRAGAKLIKDEAKRLAPDADPSGFLVAREKKLALQRAGVRFRGRKLRSSVRALVRANIVEHAIKVSDPRSKGRPTVLVRVRNAGYERVNGAIRFKKPTSAPGYWWWVEFGTSKMKARPFMRPAYERKKYFALDKFRSHVRDEIETLSLKFQRALRA